MGIKGKTTFELTDVNTGKVEVIEDTNMVTNALQELLTSYGLFGSNVLTEAITTNPLWQNLLSGLLLFDTALVEDADNTFMPAGVKMIGNGSIGVSNSGEVTELGSYNATESGLQEDGSIKFVYDFSTQQANGTIACACLTSKIGGYLGMGNAEERYNNESYSINCFRISPYPIYSGIAGATNDVGHILYPVYSENAIYFTNPRNINYSSSYASQHWSVTKKIQILKVRAGFTGVSVKDYRYLKQVIATYEVDIPQDILDYMGTNIGTALTFSDNDGNIYIIFIKSGNSVISFTNGDFVWIMKIDRHMQATAYKFTNNTGEKLIISKDTIIYNGDYVFIYQYNSPYQLYGIKYTDSTQIIETGVAKNSKYKLYNLGKNLIGIYDQSVSTNYYAPTIYDVVNRTHRLVNGKSNDNHILIPFIDKKGVYLNVRNTGNICELSIMKDSRYLATINNLSEPVVKTISKTMKVIYTLTFEEG